jgi:hypothetical protein
LPRTLSAPSASSSSKLDTAMTSAVMPSGGVPTLPPSPSMATGASTGSTRRADSWPRTQLGTFTSGVWTFESPSRRISPAAHSIAFVNAGEPSMRWPIRSQRYSSFFHPPSSVSAAPIRREALS